MFTDEELEFLDDLVSNYVANLAATRIEQAMVRSILEKIEEHFNG